MAGEPTSNRVWLHVQRAKAEGLLGSARRLARLAYTRMGADVLEFPLFPEDIADSARLSLGSSPASRATGSKLRVGWICTPPSLGSGGHTTMFRMVEGLEAAGHTCQILLYDRHGGDINYHRHILRRGWPNIRAEVVSVGSQLGGLDACIATSWQTAHVLAKRLNGSIHPFYFIQDYEPFFYPRGSMYELAADTYRFGFRNIALGHMVADCLHDEMQVPSVSVPFGCDTSVYRLLNYEERSGVVFYAKPGAPRRGFELVALALAEFHRRRPAQPIHVYGDIGKQLNVPAVQHGRLTPSELNDLYNKTIAGLAMSFTNVSLVAEEMLAAGNIAVINDSKYSRADIGNQQIAWAWPTPGGIADTLVSAVDHPDVPRRAIAAAAEVSTTGWRTAQSALVGVIENELYGSAHRLGQQPRAVTTYEGILGGI